MSNNGVPLKYGLGVIQGHWNGTIWQIICDYIRHPISPVQPWVSATSSLLMHGAGGYVHHHHQSSSSSSSSSSSGETPFIEYDHDVTSSWRQAATLSWVWYMVWSDVNSRSTLRSQVHASRLTAGRSLPVQCAERCLMTAHTHDSSRLMYCIQCMSLTPAMSLRTRMMRHGLL